MTLTEMADMIERRVMEVQKALALEALRRLVMRSPVDTGYFRNNWQVGEDAPNTSTRNGPERSGGSAMSGGATAIAGSSPESTLYITNSVSYAKRLEQGWSKQAPAGFVAITAAEIQQIADQAVDASRRA